ncbi:MAG: hypothetical protein Q4F57_04735 [Weeksellaceae bacterium]|nr:hypothetical protein [Weeksellaceae bacterium]
MRRNIILFAGFLMIYLVSDAYCYYRASGVGWIANKIPEAYYMDYEPTKNRPVTLFNSEYNAVLINDEIGNIRTGYKGTIPYPIKDFRGYFFD